MDTTVTLERMADGNYRMVDVPKANLQQETPGDARTVLSKIGMSNVEIDKIMGPKPVANLENTGIAALDKITNMEIAGIPVGAAALGAGLVIVLDRFVIAKLDPQNKWGIWANIGLAFVAKKWGAKYIGDKTADVVALLLTYEAVADYVTQLINKVMPPTATATAQQGVLHQAATVANNYYSKAFGG
jgi:hypothetical protein